MQNLYRLQIIDHYKHPRHFRTVENASVEHVQANHYCGDEITITLRIDKEHIVEAGFTGSGCALSIAGASLLLEKIQGMSVQEALTWSERNQFALVGVEPTSGRRACVLLAQQALHTALAEWEKG